jgi:hypothetical protein
VRWEAHRRGTGFLAGLICGQIVPMKVWSSVLVLLALSAALAGCSGQSPARAHPTARPVAISTVSCDQIILTPSRPDGRVVLGTVDTGPTPVPPGIRTGSRRWPYSTKRGLSIRADSPPVVVTIPPPWRGRAAIFWGNSPGMFSSVRFLSCPRQGGAWNAYAGGFYLQSVSDCVPLLFSIGRQTARLQFEIGRDNCAAA